MFAFPKLTVVVKNLLIINVLIFLASYNFGNQIYDLFASHWFEHSLFKPWQVVSHFFMHGSFNHLFRNMLMLFFIGTFLESIWGAKRFLQYYFFCGVVGYLIHSLAEWGLLTYHAQYLTQEILDLAVESRYVPGNPHSVAYIKLFNTTSVGASGAIFGILTALWMVVPNQKVFVMFIPIPIKLKFIAIALLVYELYNGLAQNPGDNVGHFAHLSGMLAGFFIIRYWQNKGEIGTQTY